MQNNMEMTQSLMLYLCPHICLLHDTYQYIYLYVHMIQLAYMHIKTAN